MTNRKTTRRALVLSLLSLLLCCSMLVGTTFAWFTDSVTSGNNKIVAGNLDIALEYSKDMKAWADVQKTETLFSANLWEPGHTEVVYLRLSNLGTLALKYQFSMNFTDTVIGKTEQGDPIKLSEHLMYDIVAADAVYEDRAAARKAVEGNAEPLATYEVKGEMLPTDEAKVMALVVYMPESVGNEANYRGEDVPQIDLGLELLATQLVHEEDSFGNDYDAGASLGGSDNVVKPQTYADLVKALAEAADGTTILLENDIQAEGNDIATYSGEGAITIDLNGHTLKGPFGTLLKLTGGTVVLKNGTLQNVHEAATETKYSLQLAGNVVAEVKDVTIETSGVGIYMADNAKITELNANITSVMNANGYCCYDAVSLLDNARIDKISGGTYESKYTDAYIAGWAVDHKYSGIASWTINLNGDGASIGEIADGTFLGVMDKANNGTPIHVNNGKVELISGGYFGFSKLGLTAPDVMLYTGANGSIEKITGGKFEKPDWKYGCDFAGIVDASGCKAEATGETVEAKVQFSTRVATYILEIVEVTSK